MFAVKSVVEELVKHLQVVGMVSGRFQCRIFESLPNELLPLVIFEIGSNIIQNLLFLEGTLDILLGTLLYLKGVELLV